MLRRSSQTTVWGYLLPLLDGLSPFGLRGAEETLGTDASCSLRLSEAALQALGPGAAAGVGKEHCRVRRAADGQPSRLRVASRKALCWVEGRQVKAGTEVALPHGARVAIGRREVVAFVFADTASSDSFRAPKELLDSYIVTHKLGEGGFGEVYLLFRKKTFMPFAMKVNEMDTDMRRKFASREAQILRNLKHPCVIRTEVAVLNPEKLYIVMEFMPGGDLSQFVNGRKLLSEAQTKLLFFQLALAVSYLHDQGICHRDLKPANILLQRRDPHTLIKVTDFGLAKGEAMHSAMTTMAGTELYLAPEVMTEKSYTKQVDVWSMGVILYFSLSGTLPFPHGMSEAIRVHHQVHFTPGTWRGVSAAALELVRRMLQVTVERRASVQSVLGSPWLQDAAMREAAYQLTGLAEVRPRPAEPAPAPAAAAAATPPPPSPRGPRGLLEYLGKDSGNQRVAAGRLTTARATPTPPVQAVRKAGLGASPRGAAGVPAGYAAPRPAANPARLGAVPKGTPSPRGSGDAGKPPGYPRVPAGTMALNNAPKGAIAALADPARGAGGVGAQPRRAAGPPPRGPALAGVNGVRGAGDNGGAARGAAAAGLTPLTARVGQIALDPPHRATPAAVHAAPANRKPLPGLPSAARSPGAPKTFLVDARQQLRHVPKDPKDPKDPRNPKDQRDPRVRDL